MTLSEVASAAGVTTAYLSLLERNHGSPGRSLLFRLSKLYKTSPEYIETGSQSSGEDCNRIIESLWPEICYMAANHVIVPRAVDPEKVFPDDECLGKALIAAWDKRHFCEYKRWSESPEGRRVGKRFRNSNTLNKVVEYCSHPFGSTEYSWIDYDQKRKLDRKPAFETQPGGGHIHRFSNNQAQSGDEPRACFVFDVDASFILYNDLPLFWGRGSDQAYRRWPLGTAFVEAAFPEVFWSASKRWTDRRMAGWLWYLKAGREEWMPIDLFAPLARIARQYDSVAQFKDASTRLLGQSSVGDCDAFLGLFPDIYANTEAYLKHGGFPERLVPLVSKSASISDALWSGPVEQRRRTRLQLNAQLCLDAIFVGGDRELCSEVESELKAKAPPHRIKKEFWIELTGVAESAPTEPAGADEPPDNLP